jgi:opacity protein-like surface antigen
VLGSGDSYSNYGIGAKFQYNVTKPIRLEGSFTYFLKKDLISMWDLSVNAHYLFPIADKLTVYPLAGLGLLFAATAAAATDETCYHNALQSGNGVITLSAPRMATENASGG